MTDLLQGVELALQNGRKVNAQDHLRGKHLAFCFANSPQLTKNFKSFYEKMIKKVEKRYETVLVAINDANEHPDGSIAVEPAFNFVELHSDSTRKLLEKCDVKSLPAIRLLRTDGTLIKLRNVFESRVKQSRLLRRTISESQPMEVTPEATQRRASAEMQLGTASRDATDSSLPPCWPL